MSKLIKVSVSWKTGFETEAEVKAFVEAIGQVHADMYATNVAKDDIMLDGVYEGARNYIMVDIKRPKLSVTGFEIGEHVNITQYKDDEFNREGRVGAISDDGQRVHVSNTNMPFMGTVSAWFDYRDLEHQE